MFLPNSYSFLLVKPVISKPVVQSGLQESATSLSRHKVGIPTSASGPSSSLSDSGKPTINDKNKRTFLKVASVAGVGLAGSLLLPKKASALIMGSSPTTGVVGVKNASNARINPAREETVSSLLKPSDLAFDVGGDLKVKVTSQPSGSSSFSDSADEPKSGLVGADRHVHVDVKSIPTSASTENTLQTIAFGGTKYTLRMETVGNYDYVGEAAIGSATSATAWRIKRIDSNDVSGNPSTIIQWANGSSGFGNIWDNRASGGTTYS